MKAIIFDMDGVLINSEVKYQELFMQFLKIEEFLLKKKNFSFLLVVLERQKTNLSQVD
ncbi:MAG: hypothetical protein ACLTTH_01095 [Holdemanella porci]